MEIKLDDHYTIVGGRHGQIRLIRHKTNLERRKDKIISNDTLFTETLCGVVNVLKLPRCPFCIRDLRSEEEE